MKLEGIHTQLCPICGEFMEYRIYDVEETIGKKGLEVDFKVRFSDDKHKECLFGDVLKGATVGYVGKMVTCDDDENKYNQLSCVNDL
jgi:hypothetical protein